MSLESRLFDAEKISVEILKITTSLKDLIATADQLGTSLQQNLGAVKAAKSVEQLSKYLVLNKLADVSFQFCH